MIRLTTLYDDYIDRPKLSEQKNLFEYILPPPLKWVGTQKANYRYFYAVHFLEKTCTG